MTSPSPVVRPAVAADVDALVALRAEMFRSMGVRDAEGRWQDAARTWFGERIASPSHAILVVQVAGTVVACAMGAVRDAAPSPAAPGGGDVLVSNVCTLPEHRGLGYGRLAFDAVMAWARTTGAARAELMATPGGRPMYERSGFMANPSVAMRAPL